MERSPIKKRWFPRPPKAVPKYLEKGEISKVRIESERISVKDQALVEFFLTSGCRVGEVYLLNKGDVDLDNRTARVLGKGKKIRHVHFSEKCAILLERYLQSRQAKEDDPLFTGTNSSKRISIEEIRKSFRKIGESAGLSRNLYPHRLRHTFATELTAENQEKRSIKNMTLLHHLWISG